MSVVVIDDNPFHYDGWGSGAPADQLGRIREPLGECDLLVVTQVVRQKASDESTCAVVELL
ncbi:hypothetical protein L1857_08605 [Amycolatopsis thermalba]|uniref:Uncharacterized protein n=1 Tax=Amycolatopsis thermalba TaxID=944492 RepID=A0ABY4NS38_9PSEU|nr:MULTISPECIES: hypothetical protein [Amycolatopsis]UQS22874.1 hypothetical protein L1857_08605 [Amycolatopsis thermalba]